MDQIQDLEEKEIHNLLLQSMEESKYSHEQIAT